MSNYIDGMIDLESVGVDNDPALIQVSATGFDLFNYKKICRFDEVIDLKSSIDAGLSVSAGSIAFWMTNPEISDEVRQRVMSETHNDNTDGKSLREVLLSFNQWCTDNHVRYIWGNGAASDNVWLRSAYKAVDVNPTFTFREDMCYRTIKTLAHRKGWVNTLPDNRGKHDAACDADYQCDCLFDMLDFLGW